MLIQDEVEICLDGEYIEIRGLTSIFRFHAFMLGIHPATWEKLPPFFEKKEICCRIQVDAQNFSGLPLEGKKLKSANWRQGNRILAGIRGALGGFVTGCVLGFFLAAFPCVIAMGAANPELQNTCCILILVSFFGLPVGTAVTGIILNMHPHTELSLGLETGEQIKITLDLHETPNALRKLKDLGIEAEKSVSSIFSQELI